MTSFLASAPDAMRIDHAYGTSTPFSLGVEEEFQLVPPGTWELTSVAHELLATSHLRIVELSPPERNARAGF